MTGNAIRLMIGLSLVPILPSLFFISYYGLDHNIGYSDELSATISLAVCITLAIGIWIGLWRTAVHWTARRCMITAGLACVFLATTGVPYMNWIGNGPLAMPIWSAPVWMWGVWIIATAWLWRDQPDRPRDISAVSGESEIGPQCPACCYSLHGMREARCPECGWTGTLDAVIVASLGLGDV